MPGNGRGTTRPREPPVNEAQLWKTSSRISTSAIETMTNDAPRTRRAAWPTGTASTATRAAAAKSAAKDGRPPSVTSPFA
jgi:hypothetical protein